MDIEKIVNDKIRKMMEDKVIEKTIEGAVEKTVVSAIESKFSGYEFRHEIKEKLSKEIDPILKDIDLSGYTRVIFERVKELTKSIVSKELLQKAFDGYGRIFIAEKTPLKISELLDMIKESYQDEDMTYDSFKLSIEIDDSRGSFSHGTIKFGLNSKSENEIRIMKYEENDYKITSLKTDHLDQQNTKAILKFSYLYDYEILLLNSMLNDRPIDLDVDDYSYDTDLYDD